MARILIIDDDAAFGELSRLRLITAGHKVDFHLGAFGTLNKAIQGYDVLIMDVYMPALSGTRLLREIRRTPGLEGVKVMLVSSMDSEPLGKLAREHGADGFVSKSTNRVDFVSRVEALLTGKLARGTS